MPDLFPLRLEAFLGFLLVFVRVSALFGFLPIFSGTLPTTTKAGFSVATALVLYPVVDSSRVGVDIDMVALGLAIAGEAMIGFITAYLVNAVFAAVQMAGYILGFQIGFGIVNVVDPATNQQVSILAQFLNITAMLLFLSLNVHHSLILGFAGSFKIIPLLGFAPDVQVGMVLVRSLDIIFVTAMQIAAPVTVTLLLKQAAMGLIARTVPQMNIFVVGFPITIGVGLLTLGLVLDRFGVYMGKQFLGVTDRTMALYPLLGG